MDWGTVMSKSITDGAPSRLLASTPTVLPTNETSTRPRRPVSACTLTRFSLHPWTVIPPPKLLAERLAPAGTAMVVSVCLCDASATSIAAASVATMSVLLLGLGGDVVHTPQQLHLAPHRVGEVKVQVCVAGVFLQRDTRLDNRPVDDGKVLPHDSHSRRIEATLILRQRGLQVSDRGVGRAPVHVRDRHDPLLPYGCRLRGDLRRPRPQGHIRATARQQHQGDARRE